MAPTKSPPSVASTAVRGEVTDHEPKRLGLSVLVPIRGGAAHIEGCLRSLAAQTLPAESWEILVVLGGPSPEARAILDVHRKEAGGPAVCVLEHPTGRTPESLNLALGVARGRFIARVDVRSRPDPDYLARLLEELERGDAACVGGVQQVRGARSWGRALEAWHDKILGAGGAAFRKSVAGSPRPADTVYLGAWPAWVFDVYGGFDESLARNQDDEYAQRLRATGETVLLCPRLRVDYRPRETLGGIWDQYLRYGFYKPRVLARYWRAWTLRCLLPPILVVGLPVFLLPWLAVMSWAAARCGDEGFAKRLAVAAAMHFGYGLGFLAGLPTALTRPHFPRRKGLEAERRRIRRRYALRDAAADDEAPSAFRRYLVPRRLEDCLRLLPAKDRDRLGSMSILEIGCGKGGFLADLKAQGVPSARMAGLDLIPERIARAREVLPDADLRVGCATALPWRDDAFDLVILPTVLSSILDDAMRKAVLAQALRVAKRYVLIHDMRWVKPGGGLRPVDAADVQTAMGPRPIPRRTSLLLPPLARRLSPVSVTLCRLLDRIPFLRGHVNLLLEARS